MDRTTRMPAAVLAGALAAVLLCSAALLAQQAPALTAQANTIYVSAEGRYEAAPDTALVQFNIAAQEDTAKAAYDRAAHAAEQVRQILRADGIDPKSAEIGFFSLAPVYDWKQPKRKLLGYRVSSNVTLKLKDFSKIPSIVPQLAEMDVTDNQSLSYTLENTEAAKIHAVQNAYERAHQEASALAQTGGRSLGELSYSSIDTIEQVRPFQPMAMARGAEAGAPPPTSEFTPHQITVTAHINALFTMK